VWSYDAEKWDSTRILIGKKISARNKQL